MVVDRAYKGAAVATTLSAPMTALAPGVGATFAVVDATGYPATGDFEIVIDRGLDSEEKIVIDSRSGTTFTVLQRGADDTTATDHASGAIVEHNLHARSIQLLVDHVDGTEADPHSTKLLNNTRHDVTARHAFGAALGTPGVPNAIVANQAGSAGVGAGPPRSDHTHAGPVTAAPVSVGTANAAGSGTNLALANHVHDLGAGVIDGVGLFASGIMTGVTQAADPGAIGANLFWFETDQRILWVRNAANSGWEMVYRIGDGNWTDYDPNFDLHGFTPGTGGGQYGRYTRVGNTIVGNAGFIIGTGGNQLGTVEFDLPVDFNTPSTTPANLFRWLGAGRSFHTPSGARFSGIGLVNPSTDANTYTSFATAGTTAIWDTNTPENWDVNHEFHAFFMGEAD